MAYATGGSASTVGSQKGDLNLFSKIGIDSAVSVSVSLMNYLFMVLVGLLGGLIYFVLTSLQKRE